MTSAAKDDGLRSRRPAPATRASWPSGLERSGDQRRTQNELRQRMHRRVSRETLLEN